jgi:Flp pilus assembly protein TadD
LRAGQFKEAASAAEQSVQRLPKDPRGHFLLGAAREGLGDLPGATAAVGRALELDSAYPPALEWKKAHAVTKKPAKHR